MKILLLLPCLAIVLFSTSCGPAAENRDVMHSRAKTISDSMANLIKVAMQEAEMPPMNVIKIDTAAARANAAANNTVAPK